MARKRLLEELLFKKEEPKVPVERKITVIDNAVFEMLNSHLIVNYKQDKKKIKHDLPIRQIKLVRSRTEFEMPVVEIKYRTDDDNIEYLQLTGLEQEFAHLYGIIQDYNRIWLHDNLSITDKGWDIPELVSTDLALQNREKNSVKIITKVKISEPLNATEYAYLLSHSFSDVLSTGSVGEIEERIWVTLNDAALIWGTCLKNDVPFEYETLNGEVISRGKEIILAEYMRTVQLTQSQKTLPFERLKAMDRRKWYLALFDRSGWSVGQVDGDWKLCTTKNRRLQA